MAPFARAGIEATVFKRQGRVEDGVLSFTSRDRSPVEYRIVGDYLVGRRRGMLGSSEITMSREDKLAQVPLPPRKPVRS